MRKIVFTLAVLFCWMTGATPARAADERMQVWPFLENAAIQDQRDRNIEGISYLVGGVSAIALPYLTISEGSALRAIGTVILVPTGIYSIAYGGYTLLTDSPWMTLKNKVERLAGPKENSAQWRLRREMHARQVLLDRADSTRFWRYLWGGVEGGAGVLLLTSDRSAPSVITASLLFGLSAFHLFYRKADERVVDHLDQVLDKTAVGVSRGNGVYLARKFRF